MVYGFSGSKVLKNGVLSGREPQKNTEAVVPSVKNL